MFGRGCALHTMANSSAARADAQGIALVGRQRLATVVQGPDFARREKRDGVEKLTITFWSRLLALKTLATGEALAVGDTPLADTKEQATAAAANVGLLAALSLTIVWPMACDATDSLQTNAYILSSPAPVGQIYFVMLWVCSVALFMSTLSTVAVMIGLSELTTELQARYFCSVARSELFFSVKYLLVAGFLFMCSGAMLLVITTFDTTVAEDCATTNTCPSTLPALVVALTLTSLIGLHGALVVTSAVAKIYKTMAKFAPVLQSAERKSNPSESYILDAGVVEVWRELSEYWNLNSSLATPLGFKEFLIYRASGAQALSYRCEQVADSLFKAKVKSLVKKDHESVAKRLDELKRADERFADFPTELDVE